jgi:hypothetical protein
MRIETAIHPTFGEGMILSQYVSASGKAVVVVRFPDGERTIVASYLTFPRGNSESSKPKRRRKTSLQL